MGSMRLSFVGMVLGALGVAAGAVACSPTYDNYPPLSGCPVDAGHCSAISGGASEGAGGSKSTSSTGAGGATAESSLLGGVDLISAPTFADTGTAYSGAANIVALPPVGSTITSTFAGGAGATFDLLDMPSGNSWILVQDTSGGSAGIVSTYSGPWGTPNPSPITLPVLSSQLLTNIASDLPGTLIGGVSSLAAQVVLIVTHGGAPYQGLSVTGGAGGAHVVYDIGPGAYSDTTSATSTGGTIILFNMSTTSTTATISLTDTATAVVYSVPVQTAPGTATLFSASPG